MNNEKIPRALTIAGLDSGGGAGIIADIKAFSALGVWGMVALTAITAQNTKGVFGVQDVELDLIRKQIEVVVEDIGVDAAKTGMLHSTKIIETVANTIENYDFPVVVDPVMIAESGYALIKPEAMEALKKRMIPLAKVITPNHYEAEALTGMKIRNIEDMKRAAKLLVEEYGCEAAIVKGGHFESGNAIDIMYYKGEYYEFSTPKVPTKNTHGTGCAYSAAIAAGLAKGMDLVDAVRLAKQYIYQAILYGPNIGEGVGPINHMAYLYREAERYKALKELEKAVDAISKLSNIGSLIPEVGMNVAYALKYSVDTSDIVAIPGRIRRWGNKAIYCECPEFGASDHLARYIMAMRKYDPSVRVAINIRYSEELLEKLSRLGLKISYYDRTKEPKEIKEKEGSTVPWGVEQAIKNIDGIPEVIYHKGDLGKEPMIVIFGKSLNEVISILEKILS